MAGYIKDHRKELDSGIWLKPPLYHRVWQYLKYKANHEEADIQMGDGSSYRIKPGQHLTSIRTIAKGVGWTERGKFQEPNPKTIDSILKWLKEQKMIEIEAVTGNTPEGVSGNRSGTLITLINWAFYQVSDVSGNSLLGGVTCYQGTKQELKDITTTTSLVASAPESMKLPEPDFTDSELEPFIQVLNTYCTMHNRLDIHIRPQEREIMGRMIAGGVPSPFIIRTMTILLEEKRKREGERFRMPSSFKYYEDAILEAWRNESAITTVPPVAGVALDGYSPQTAAMPISRVAPGNKPRYLSKREKTNAFLKQAWGGDSDAEERCPETVFDHEQRLPQLRG